MADCSTGSARSGAKGLIAYLTAGDPAPERTPALVEALVRGGADLIELGVPFSDPVADGPVIQRAGERALAAGTTLRKVLDIAARIRQAIRGSAAAVHLSEPGDALRLRKLAEDAARLRHRRLPADRSSVEEAEEYVEAMRGAGLDTIFLAAPTSTARRLGLVARYSTGFVYLVSRTGVTGERDALSGAARPLVDAMREMTDLPLAVGFGISRPEHVAELRRLVDAAVVGSAFVRLIGATRTERRRWRRTWKRWRAS